MRRSHYHYKGKEEILKALIKKNLDAVINDIPTFFQEKIKNTGDFIDEFTENLIDYFEKKKTF